MPTLIEILPDYHKYLLHELKLALSTQRCYISDIRRLEREIGDKALADITKKTLRSRSRATGVKYCSSACRQKAYRESLRAQ